MNDIIILCATEIEQNENGYLKEEIVSGREVFAEKKSATRSEFYSAMATGINISAVFLVAKLDYESEKLILYKDKRYHVERSYSTADSDYVELSCSDLKEV